MTSACFFGVVGGVVGAGVDDACEEGQGGVARGGVASAWKVEGIVVKNVAEIIFKNDGK